MCALAEGNLMPGASSQFETGLPNSAGRYDGRGVDHGSPAELSRATRLSRPARPVSDQRHFVALLYTLSRDTTKVRTRGSQPSICVPTFSLFTTTTTTRSASISYRPIVG